MSDTFPYYNKKTGTVEQRPTQPSFFQRAYENAAYDADVDTQRSAYNKMQSNVGKAYSNDVPDSLQGSSEE